MTAETTSEVSTEKQIRNWTTAWALINGAVVCTACKVAQAVTEADDEFKHAAGCSAIGQVDLHPWVALHDALDHERG